MRILYDYQIFCFQDYGGISRYFYELIKNEKETDNLILLDGKFSNNKYIHKLKSNVVSIFPKTNFPHKNILLFYLNRLLSIGHLIKKDFDILHVTYFHPYFLKKLNRPYVVTVYDMIPEIFAEDFKGMTRMTLEFKRKTICNANRIIAISENTKKDLINIYGITEDVIDVIHLGNPLQNVVLKVITGLPERYILFVGNRSGYKNFNFFVKAVAPVIKKYNNIFVVCAGGGKFSVGELNILSDLRIKEKVKQIQFYDDGELAYLYKNALVYILPSLYEGFGLTLLEAFSMGCPVIASNTSSVPEVCAAAVLYINPKKEKSIRGALLKVINDPFLRGKLRSMGFKRVKKFSWIDMTNKTLAVYSKVLDGGAQ